MRYSPPREQGMADKIQPAKRDIEKYSAAVPQLAGRLTDAELRLAISDDCNTARVQSYAKIERSAAVVETRLALDDLTLWNGREVARKTNRS